VLDFQDALYGPMTYDLASLLRDAYVWDEELVLDWAIRYWQHAKSLGLPVNPTSTPSTRTSNTWRCSAT
jgi:aminoglycoside/choline kinase family phosphotransferase